MSVYDFNHNEHVNHVNHSNNKVTSNNGTQQVRYQVENDYMGRGFSSTHHLDMSVQLTRPTSKTAMLVRQRRAMLEQLSCFLCKGYLIDATTIDECMDSFCKSCIVIYLRNHIDCPKCGALIHKTNPLSTIRSDKVLQDIVYKLVPGLYDNEMRRRREFYKNLYGASSDEDDEDGSSSSLTGRCSNLSGEQYGVVSHPKPFYKPTDSIDLSIEPQTRNDSSTIYYDNRRQSIVTCFTSNVQQTHDGSQNFSAVDSQQFKTYLRCPAKLTALQLKKFIAAKFNICKDDTIHLLYLNESLKDKYSLIDIAYIYDWRGIEHMRLFYIIERDLTRSDEVNSRLPSDGQAHPTKSRQHSVGTQVVKRVCIDPRPRFYEVESNSTDAMDDNKNNSANVRNMRPRTSDASSSTTFYNKHPASNHSTTQPILRSQSLTRPVSEVSNPNGTAKDNGKFIMTSASRHQQASQPHSYAVPRTIDELTGFTRSQEGTKETRSTRKVNNDSSSSSIPKININLSSLNQTKHNSTSTAISSYNPDDQRREVTTKQTTIRQLVPYVRRGGESSLTNPSLSSLVTLANFTEARNSSVVSINSSSSATISNSFKNIISSGTSARLDVKSDGRSENGNQMIKQSVSSAPQLAFSYVTERGITIVRHKSNQEDASSSTASKQTSGSNNNALPALLAPSHKSSPVVPVRSATSHSASNSVQSQAGTSGTSSTSSSQSSNQGHHNFATSARHHIKVKPVYKTFVDPTKLKSPNFKKLGSTARH